MNPSVSPTNGALSAMLLAGGKSSRMGKDKAGVVVSGEPLWQRQIATLNSLNARELFISGRRNGPYADSRFEIVEDLFPGAGPLAGLEAASHRIRTPFLAVLAVDLPLMRSDFLGRMVERAMQRGCGIIPTNGEYFEPLAAVYGTEMLGLAGEFLRETDHSLQRFIRQAVELELAEAYPLSAEEQILFRNVNTPADLTGF